MEKVAMLVNEIEAQIVDAALEERGIPHRIKSYHDSALDGLIQFVQGWGHIEAPLENKAEVLEILEGLRSETARNEPASPDPPFPDQPQKEP